MSSSMQTVDLRRGALVLLLLQVTAAAWSSRSPTPHTHILTPHQRQPLACLAWEPLREGKMARNGVRAWSNRQWDRYNRALYASPLLVQAITAAVLGGMSDIIAQVLEGASAFVLARFVALALVNIVYITPLLALFYAANEWLVGEALQMPADSWRGTCLRLGIDQLLFAPICIAGFFWAYGLTEGALSCVVEGRPLECAVLRDGIGTKLSVEYRAMVISNWQVWILPQLINFRLIPPALRLPF